MNDALPTMAAWSLRIVQIGRITRRSMRLSGVAALAAAVCLATGNAWAESRYVSPNGAGIPPYTTWNDAARTIQDAVDACSDGDEVWVGPGIYDTGGRRRAVPCPVQMNLNRVLVDKAIRLISTDGPDATHIAAGTNTLVRGILAIAPCEVEGFTIRDMFASPKACGLAYNEVPGGSGVLSTTNAVFRNCVISNCVHVNFGGGSFGPATFEGCVFANNQSGISGGAISSDHTHPTVLVNCWLHDNTAGSEGGAGYDVNMINCTVTANSSNSAGGGISGGTAVNTILQMNFSPSPGNTDYTPDTILTYSCATPLPPGEGNISGPPLLWDKGRYEIHAASPCRNAGRLLPGLPGFDFTGKPRVQENAVDMGCFEVDPGLLTGPIMVEVTPMNQTLALGIAAAFTITAKSSLTSFRWTWGDGSESTTDLTSSHVYQHTGIFHPILMLANATHATNIQATVNVFPVGTNFVSIAGASVPPFATWQTAAHTIQDAVEAAVPGNIVLVDAGHVETNVVTKFGYRYRFKLEKPLTLASRDRDPRSVQILGSLSEEIAGARVDVAQCRIEGLTFSHCRHSVPGFTSGLLSYSDTRVDNCIFAGNHGVVIRGGIHHRLSVHDNTEETDSVAADQYIFDGARVYNSLAYANQGPVLNNAQALNCTMVENASNSQNENHAHIFYASSVLNSIIIQEDVPRFAVATQFERSFLSFNAPGNNLTGPEPGFVNSAQNFFALAPWSPCIDEGRNLEPVAEIDFSNPLAPTYLDLMGAPRVGNRRVDIGAYEFYFDGGIRARLQGPLSAVTGLMSADAPVALQSPYSSDPRVATAIPTGTVDWVLLELYSQTNQPPVFARSVLLRNDGQLTTESGDAVVPIDVTPMTNYWVAVKHRGHLASVTASAIPFTNNVVDIDFTAGPASYLGGTSVAARVGTNWAARAGDVDGDGAVTGLDFSFAGSQAGSSGNLRGDLNRDGVVDTLDQAFVMGNVGSTSPGFDTALSPSLLITPDRRTLVSGESLPLLANGPSGTRWVYAANRTGSALSATNGTAVTYTAGPAHGQVDVVQAWDRRMAGWDAPIST